jgi:hypothetical protein
MSVTDTLRDALIADITDYTSYSLRPRSIERIPVDESVLRKPAVMAYTGAGGRAIRETLGPGKNLVTQEFDLLVFVDGKDPVQELDNLTDDIRNLLERTAGTLISSQSSNHGVEDVNVIAWSEPLTGEGIADGVYFRKITVEVTYVYVRGSA